eukprot:CAMPEP_0116825496 /NCGR_PEP_ID=MMETSP0418-20121206/1998_1 /TAXON_ID=1158023 /ORGANISM="Astrosyne radiata, Strain 13vi08-1A" /LENGTH=209 /DNA_ID=CAMNT_0004454011 /DNA_START=655 /DNA_END=1284 /DNA_ORIENTATION=-
MAVRQGGAASEGNPRLRLALQNAKNANLPKDNMERAIQRGNSKDAITCTEVTYEGYAVHGVAIMVECMTDNLNRTVAALRTIFAKHGGSLGKSGSIAFLFDRKGAFTIRKTAVTEEALTVEMIEAGAEAIHSASDHFCITCSPEAFGKVQQRLERLQIVIEDAKLQHLAKPLTSVILHQQAEEKVIELIDTLEIYEDVQRVSHNMVTRM